MNDKKVSVVIAGGGTAGWLTAFSLIKRLGKFIDVSLIESDQIGTVGVGEATIPTMRSFHQLLEIDEREFMQATQATFKLGIQFENWGALNQSYIHSFGRIGQGTWMAEFHQYWLAAKDHGFDGTLDDFCLELKAARENKFAHTAGKTPLNYAYHLNATAYAQYLREKSEALGVRRVEGKITRVQLEDSTGEIETITVDSNLTVAGDLFIDCTGFRALLLGDKLGIGYNDWSQWLAADSAIAVQTENTGVIPPYTRAIAHQASWQWRIPLQSRTGNGIVYSSRFLSDADAESTLVSNLNGTTITEPRKLSFRTGCRKKFWHKNCVAIGLSSGFLEPLESTSIHLITTAIVRLMKLFPFSGNYDSLQQRFNQETAFELEAVRDFIILHYKQTARNDSDYWRHHQAMPIPDSLTHRLELFREQGFVWPDEVNLFRVDSWIQVMMGQGLVPQNRHRAGEILPADALKKQLQSLRSMVNDNLGMLPSHEEFLKSYCMN